MHKKNHGHREVIISKRPASARHSLETRNTKTIQHCGSGEVKKSSIMQSHWRDQGISTAKQDRSKSSPTLKNKREEERPLQRHVLSDETRLRKGPTGRSLCDMRPCHSHPIQRHHGSLQSLVAQLHRSRTFRQRAHAPTTITPKVTREAAPVSQVQKERRMPTDLARKQTSVLTRESDSHPAP